MNFLNVSVALKYIKALRNLFLTLDIYWHTFFYNILFYSFLQSGLSHHDWQHHCDNGLLAALAFAVRVALIDPLGSGQHWNIDCVDIL